MKDLVDILAQAAGNSPGAFALLIFGLLLTRWLNAKWEEWREMRGEGVAESRARTKALETQTEAMQGQTRALNRLADVGESFIGSKNGRNKQ